MYLKRAHGDVRGEGRPDVTVGPYGYHLPRWVAVLTGAGAVLHTAKVSRGQSVAVFGAGSVGLSAIAAAAIAGANPILAVDLVDRKLQFAREFGVTHGINASNTDADGLQEMRAAGQQARLLHKLQLAVTPSASASPARA